MTEAEARAVIADAVKARRQNRRQNQTQEAQAFGMSRNSYCGIEAGKFSLTRQTLRVVLATLPDTEAIAALRALTA